MPSNPRVREERILRAYEAQDGRADALDTKAGLVLGFSGLLLVSLTPGAVWPPLGLLARLVSVGAAVLSLRAVVVRLDMPMPLGWPAVAVAARHTRLEEMRRAMLHRDLAVDRKWWRIRAAVALLVIALVTIAMGTTVTAVLEWRSR